MRSQALTPGWHDFATALLLTISLVLLSSGCSTSANENLGRANPAPPPIEFLGSWGTKGTGPGMLSDPRTIAADAFGEVYIVDAGTSASYIHKFTRDGRPLLSFEPTAPIHNPCASTVDLGGAIYTLECGPGALYVFKPEGDLLRAIRGGLGAPAQPSSVTVSYNGTIYVAESHSKKILRYTPRGRLLGAWGGKGTGRGAQRGSTLHADQIVASLDGALFVCDSDRGWIARISSSGIVQKEWTLPSSSTGAIGHCSLAVTRTSVIVLTGPSTAPVLHVFSYDGQEKFSKPLQDLNSAFASITFAGIAAMQDGELFILDSSAPRVLHLRLNM